ncbi:MAG: hypothetical protein J6C82_01630 [Clostridia bacterium]|nr:hypothetical protein [Clostridia bacterium]
MKKIISLLLAMLMLTSQAYAFTFPEPDWGALLKEKTDMVYETDFELYTEGPVSSAPYYGAKLEPQGGTYFGIITENSDFVQPVGSYLTYFSMDDRQPDIYYPANQIISENNSVVTIGYTVNSLDAVNYDVIRQSLDTLASYNKPMFIRFANEMNVSSLGDDPARYIEVFRNVANMVHEYPNFATVWSPNDMGALDRPFEYFYPGDEYVDWIGVSSYMKMYFQGRKDTLDKEAIYFMTGDYAWSTNALKPIIKFMQDNNIQKPVMISEGGIATENQYGEDCSVWASPRFRNMYYNVIMKYPQVKLINYFNTYRRYEAEKFYVRDTHATGTTDKDYAKYIMSEAANSGAYIRNYGASPEFVFVRADAGHTLTAENGVVNLYTLAYLPKKPYITVNYTLDGTWYHSAQSAPYTCALDISALPNGAHTLEISSEGLSKSYTFYKKGNSICFGQEPEASPIQVTVNGSAINFDAPPVIIDGRTLVPVRAIFNALGAAVEWDADSKTAFAEGRGHKINITVGENMLIKDGTPISLDVPAQIISDRIFVPARAVSEALDCLVNWDGATNTVVITG